MIQFLSQNLIADPTGQRAKTLFSLFCFLVVGLNCLLTSAFSDQIAHTEAKIDPTPLLPVTQSSPWYDFLRVYNLKVNTEEDQESDKLP